MIIFWCFLPLAFGLSWWLTGQLRRYALARQLLDVPDQRSSHTQPTPRGGGLAIVISFYLSLMLLAFAMDTGALFWALLGAGLGVAALGFIDDHGHIPAQWRLLGHFAAAAWALYWLGLPALELAGFPLGLLVYPLAAVYLVWMLNLYNFMDGIDGIASVQALCACLSAALLYVLTDEGIAGELLAPFGLLLSLAAAVAGFLLWNLPPARIFMGDVGSGFLGLVLGIFSIQAANINENYFWAWLILLGIFVVDASFTLMRRLCRGEKIYQAHRSHAYQRAARALGGHGHVTLIVATINFLWLLPLALAVGLGWLLPWIGLGLAYLPLSVLVLALGAGKP